MIYILIKVLGMVDYMLSGITVTVFAKKLLLKFCKSELQIGCICFEQSACIFLQDISLALSLLFMASFWFSGCFCF